MGAVSRTPFGTAGAGELKENIFTSRTRPNRQHGSWRTQLKKPDVFIAVGNREKSGSRRNMQSGLDLVFSFWSEKNEPGH